MNLFVVATPIGNLGDISSRALETLREVDVILCEDTRVTRKLLSKYDIHAKVESFHSNSNDAKLEKVFGLLEKGSDLALVTDAGTPAISDPGSRLVSLVRARFGEGISVIAIPGPSALSAALSISGLPVSDFLFLGFLPRKKGRQTLFSEIAESKRTVVFYESPHRIVKTLEDLDVHCGDRQVVIAREITKIYEEVLVGTATEILQVLEDNEKKQKGEFVVMIRGK